MRPVLRTDGIRESTAGSPADGVDELSHGGCLDHETGGAYRECSVRVLRVVVRRHHGRRFPPGELPEEPEAVSSPRRMSSGSTSRSCSPSSVRASSTELAAPATSIRAAWQGASYIPVVTANRIFHVSHVDHALEAVLAPGHFGTELTPESRLRTRETALEAIRQVSFPERPSRLAAVFGYPSAQTAIEWVTRLHADGEPDRLFVFEAEAIEPASIFLGNLGWLEGATTLPVSEWPARAFSYWAGVPWPASPLAWEVIVGGSVRIIRRVSGPI